MIKTFQSKKQLELRPKLRYNFLLAAKSTNHAIEATD